MKCFKFFICSFFLILFSDSTLANVKTWTGTVSTEWNVANNWSPVGIPTIQDTVNSSYGDIIMIPSGYNAKAKRARLFGRFTINGNLLIDGSGLLIYGDFTNNGIVRVENCVSDGFEMTSAQVVDTNLLLTS